MKMGSRFKVILLSALTALPLLLTAGCAESGFSSENESQSLSQNEDESLPRLNPDAEGEASAPLAECAKPGSKKVLVCHVPPGNPDAKHTICISAAGATHGHGLNLADPYAVGSHGGDRLGQCDDELPEE